MSRCLRSSLSLLKRTNTTERAFCFAVVLLLPPPSVTARSYESSFFYLFIIFHTSRPPFHPTKSVSCSPLRRADQIFEADTDAARTGRMINTDSKTGFHFFLFFFLINTRWIPCNKMTEIIKDLTRFAIITLRWCRPLRTMITTLLPLLRRLLLLAGQKIGWDIWGDFQGGGCCISHVSTFFPEWHVVVALVPKRNQLVSTGSLFEGVKKDIFRLRRLKAGVEMWNLPRPGTITTEPLHRRKIVATYEEEDAKKFDYSSLQWQIK